MLSVRGYHRKLDYSKSLKIVGSITDEAFGYFSSPRPSSKYDLNVDSACKINEHQKSSYEQRAVIVYG
jgi:hypothetical protein